MKANGRPKKEINKKQFEALCYIQATQAEICQVLDGIDPKTLNRWCRETYGRGFSQIYEIKRAGGKMSLRRNQFELSKRSAAMAIWLGKQWLGQRDEPQMVDISEEQAGVKIYIPNNGREGKT